MHYFISHSTKDAPEHAMALVKALEAAGHKCWVAPRDVTPGASYPGQIVAAIRASKGLILLATPGANQSRDVLQEVERAHAEHKTITPVMFPGAPLSDDLSFYIRVRHQIAWAGPDAVVRALKAEAAAAKDEPTAEKPVPAASVPSSETWKANQQPKLRFTRNHGGSVAQAVWRPDGAQFATASNNGAVQIWDSKTGRPVNTLVPNVGNCTSLAWSPDQARILVGGSQGVCLLAPNAGEAGEVEIAHYAEVTEAYSVQFSPDGQKIAALSFNKNFFFFADLIEFPSSFGARMQARSAPFRIAFSPDSELLAIGGQSFCEIFDIAGKATLIDLRGLTAAWPRVTFSPATYNLLTATYSDYGAGSLSLWDIHTGAMTRDFAYKNLVCAAFASDGLIIAAGTSNGEVLLFSADLENIIRMEVFATLNSVAFSPDNRSLLLALGDGRVMIFDHA